MSETCPDCNFCEVMPDGSLFCALFEMQVHGDQSCQAWLSDDGLFIDAGGVSFGEEDY